MNECTSWTTEQETSFIISYFFSFVLAPEVALKTATRLLGCA